MDRAYSGVCWPQCEIVMAKEEPESHLVGQSITNTTTVGIRTSTIVICSPGLLIEKTIKPNHQQQGIIENFPIGDMI